MKRFFTLILVVCALMNSAVCAESSSILQDEQPPKVVAYVNETGDVVVGKICNESGVVIAEIKDDGSMDLADVHQRETAQNEMVAHRLTRAYKGIMYDVNYSDVACALHGDVVKVDINEVLEGLDNKITAYDLVMCELFDVSMADNYTEMLTDGCYLELTLELVEEQSLPLIIIFTEDGVEWEILNYTVAGDNRFIVRLSASGTLALLIDGRSAMGIGEELQTVENTIQGQADNEYATEAAIFTPSVSGKAAPEIVTSKGADGETNVGYIRNNAGDLEIPVPNKNYIIVTPVSKRDYVVDIQTHEHLEWGYDSILGAENVGELFGEHDVNDVISADEHSTIASLLDEVLVKMGVELTHEQLVVKDLFEVTAYGNYLEYLYDVNNYLEITFDADLEPGQSLAVIHSHDSVHWHVHPIEETVVNADGTVTLKMYELGVVAFLVEAEENTDTENLVQSPN